MAPDEPRGAAAEAAGPGDEHACLRLLSHAASPDRLQGPRDLLPAPRHLLVGEGPVRRPELEPQREALPGPSRPGRRGRGRRSARSGAARRRRRQRRANPLGRDVLGHDHGEVLEHRRVGGDVLVQLLAARRQPEERRRGRARTRSRRQVPRRGDRGWSSPIQPAAASADGDRCGPARCRKGSVCGASETDVPRLAASASSTPLSA